MTPVLSTNREVEFSSERVATLRVAPTRQLLRSGTQIVVLAEWAQDIIDHYANPKGVKRQATKRSLAKRLDSFA